MKSVLRGLGKLIAGLAVAFLLVVVVARFQDGPFGPIAGGPFESGDWVETRGLDWSFVTDLDTVEFQLLDPARSRTVWAVVHDGSVYIPCGVPHFTLWKQWPHEALADGRAVIRSAGKRYAVNLVKADAAAERAAVLALVSDKYGQTALDGEDPGDLVWVFRLDARAADS